MPLLRGENDGRTEEDSATSWASKPPANISKLLLVLLQSGTPSIKKRHSKAVATDVAKASPGSDVSTMHLALPPSIFSLRMVVREPCLCDAGSHQLLEGES